MRKIIVLGATSALAMETAKLFAAEGCSFFLVARNSTKLEAVKGDLLVRGAKQVEALAADMSDLTGHEKILDRADKALGGYNMVFIAYGTLGDQKACERDFHTAEKELKTNFLSVVSVLTPVANYFEAKKEGAIVVISSVAGDRARQSNYIYGVGKGAVSLYLQGLRNRLFPAGVKVLTVKPGFVDTPMTAGMKKGPLFVTPDVVARGIVRAVKSGNDVVYLPWFWLIIMTVIRSIPEAIFKRLKL